MLKLNNSTLAPIKMNKILYLLLIVVFFASCADNQKEFTQTINSTEGIADAAILYLSGTEVDGNTSYSDTLFSKPLILENLIITRSDKPLFSIQIADNNGITQFNNIPAKYIHLDASLEITRNVFHDYFPKEWEPLKGSNYTSLYIQSKNDKEVFYIKTVASGTSKEIGLHSEDF
jgi:hypothetical protein